MSKTVQINQYITLIRPLHWAKNLLVFLPLMTAFQLDNPSKLISSLFAFIAYCCCASSIYIINDLKDIAHDKKHHIKKSRPLCKETISKNSAILLAIFILVAAISIALLVSPIFLYFLLSYYLLSILYCFFLKRLILVDIITLSCFYIGRIYAGGLATEIVISQWLLGYTSILFCSLALLKRYIELRNNTELNAQNLLPGRGYSISHIKIVLKSGLTLNITSSIILIFYIYGDYVNQHYQTPSLLLISFLIVLIWGIRGWSLALQGKIINDPVVFTIKDRFSYLAIFLIIMIAILAR